ncbi:MAG: tryptophan-rich sensory protein [Candidatus Omnitrophica bacterium]|nr:tryptophan-rich sensory protein [Candidatus Omnitrophota bacterium]
MLKLIISIIVCHCAGIIGAVFTQKSIPGWYEHIKKPSFNPPGWVFGPVWVTLYTMMGIAAYIVWKKGFQFSGVKAALTAFLIQLILNSLWSIVFFGGRSIGGALVVIVFLWLSILWTMAAFFLVSRPACFLLLPYILWVSFAVVLNIELFKLNQR